MAPKTPSLLQGRRGQKRKVSPSNLKPSSIPDYFKLLKRPEEMGDTSYTREPVKYDLLAEIAAELRDSS